MTNRDTYLFDVTVLVATLQPATQRGQSQLADNKNHENHFSLGSIGTKIGKQNHNNQNFHYDQLITTKSSLTDQLISSTVL